MFVRILFHKNQSWQIYHISNEKYNDFFLKGPDLKELRVKQIKRYMF